MHQTDIIPVNALREKTQYVFQRLKQKGITCAALSVLSHKGFSLNFRAGVIDALEYDDAQALSLKIFLNKKTASISTTNLSRASLNQAIEKVLSLIRYVQEDKYSGLPSADELAFNFSDLSLYHPFSISVKQATAQMVAGEKVIDDCSTSNIKVNAESLQLTTHDGYVWLANTINTFEACYAYSNHSLTCQAIAKVNDQMQVDYDYAAARSPKKLESINVIAKNAASRTIKRLNARSAKAGAFPIIFEARVAVSLWRHLLAAIEGMSIYRQMSFLKDSLGKMIFPTFINVCQKPHIIQGLYSAPFDAEGVLTKNIHYIEKGRLTNYILSTYSARRLGLKTTGNAGGVYNIEVSSGDDSLKALCQKMRTGYLITEFLGQGVNIVTGDYSRGAFGYWIENGKIQYPVHELTIAGNLKQMFQQILAIGKDRTLYTNISTGSVLIDHMVVSAS
jgi:PmbA protein